MFKSLSYICVLVTQAYLISSCTPASTDVDHNYTQWTRYEAEPGATTFSALDQINRSNIDQLEIAWTYESPDVGDINPIIVDSIMYVSGEDNAIVALHAGTGRELWVHESKVSGSVRAHGVTYWESDDRSERRLFFPKGSYSLIAIDAITGESIASFGENGSVDMRQGLGPEIEKITRVTAPAPGVIFEDLIILGSSPGEGYWASPGHIRAYDVRTGEQAWIFHTLPKPGEYGYDTWPEGRSDEGGGANAWGGMSVDVKRGMVYIPLGSANYDFYGADRHGANLFANSLVALNARTGERVWHFQTIHHDLWDYDLTATPVLLTAEYNSKKVDIVSLATKTGLVFAFNRETGEPVWPVEEVPVPASEMPGEQAWPTQPIPTKPEPFIPIEFDMEEDFNPYLVAAERDSILDYVRGMHYQGMYTPPSTRPTLQVPGNRGGANWGSTAGDPRDATFFVLSYNLPSILELIPIVAGKTGTGSSPFDIGQGLYQENCQLCHGVNRKGQAGGPSLERVTDLLNHDELQEVIRSGRALMPAFPQLSTSEFESLTMYLANPELALVQDEPIQNDEVPISGTSRYQSAWRHVLDSKGVPMIKPPWFRLTAYDMNQGTIKWQIPVGETDHLAAQGVLDTGESIFIKGGPAITAGGLVFISTDDKFLAYDIDDGAELWSAPLPATGQGIPAVYDVGGRQFVAIGTNASSRWGQLPSHNHPRKPQYIAFALPDSAE